MMVLGAAALAFLLLATPAYAIPSPDLIAGSLSSVSQLLTLASAAIGGLAFTGTRFVPSASTGMAGRAGLGLRWIAGIALAALAASLALNGYQFLARHDARLARLQATLVRPSHDPGMPILDPTLKELPYDAQVKSPDGITTQQLADLLKAADRGTARDVNFIDVRETAETELGVLPHFTPVRWPDLASSGIDFKGKRNVLICQNGNRSSETCGALNAQGIPCNFVIGGLEKWVAEGRPLGAPGERPRDQLRGVPSYPNDRVLLDTTQVRKLISDEHAVVVDSRYPGEFAHHHMWGAINIPIRRMPTPELNRRISALPHRPVILACYDRRSCFMSEVLGLELSRAGFDVRGRYTTPWEYFVPAAEPPYVAQWRERVNGSWWGRASRHLGNALNRLAGTGMGLVGAIALLALLSRLVVLPFSVKAERDQLKLRTAESEIAAIKERFKGDPKRLSRSLRGLHKRYGVTPGRNALTLLFLPVLAISVASVNAAVHQQPRGYFWMHDLSARDPWLLLPAAFSILVVAYLVWSLARTPRQKIVTCCLGLPAFGVLANYMSAAADLYMLVSAGLMIAQRAAIAIDLGALRRRRVRRRAERTGRVALADAHLLPGCGNKAARLGALLAQGLPVPNGAVLAPHFFARFQSFDDRARRQELDKVWKRLGAARIAVRSSAAAEDGAEHSFAGVFETVLNVERDGLAAAIAKVHASFTAARTASYGVSARDAYILLQPMVNAEYAGVMFTQAPGSGGLAMVEMVRGTADAFVSGAAAPETYLLGRYSGRLVDGAEPPIDLAPLFALGRRAEAIFGGPQDIEWAFHDGGFVLLQSRDITRTGLDEQAKGNRERLERERARLLALMMEGGGGTLAQSEISELLPRPTPLSFDLMESLWQSGGSVDLACRALGLSYRVEEDGPPYLATVFGRLYVNAREARLRAPRIGLVAAMRLERAAASIEETFRSDFVPDFADRIRLLEATDFSRLTVPELQAQVERVRLDFIGRSYAQVDVINIAASYYMERATAALQSRGLNPTAYIGDIPDMPLPRALAAAISAPAPSRLDTFQRHFGHRAALDYELALPRYAEDCDAARALVAMAEATPSPKREARAPAEQDWQDPSLVALVDRARRFQALKEEAKHQAMRELAVLRAILLALDGALDLDGKIFHLTFAEITALTRELPVPDARRRIADREADAAAFATVPGLPTEIGLAQLEALNLAGSAAVAESDGWHKGTLVSGDGMAEGRACVVADDIAVRGAPLPDFTDGDIIVSRTIHPAWLPYFSRAGGFVCEIGGWLSHIAILAREYDVHMVVGVRSLAAIEAGQFLRLHADGRIETVQSERASERVTPVRHKALAVPRVEANETAALRAAQ